MQGLCWAVFPQTELRPNFQFINRSTFKQSLMVMEKKKKKKLWLQVGGDSSIRWLSSAELSPTDGALEGAWSRVTAAFSSRGRAVFDILGWECTLQKFQASLIFFLLRRKQSLVFGWQAGEYAAVLDLVFLSVFSLYVISYWVHDVEIRPVGAQTICSSPCSSCGICQFIVTLDVCYSAE